MSSAPWLLRSFVVGGGLSVLVERLFTITAYRCGGVHFSPALTGFTPSHFATKVGGCSSPQTMLGMQHRALGGGLIQKGQGTYPDFAVQDCSG